MASMNNLYYIPKFSDTGSVANDTESTDSGGMKGIYVVLGHNNGDIVGDNVVRVMMFSCVFIILLVASYIYLCRKKSRQASDCTDVEPSPPSYDFVAEQDKTRLEDVEDLPSYWQAIQHLGDSLSIPVPDQCYHGPSNSSHPTPRHNLQEASSSPWQGGLTDVGMLDRGAHHQDVDLKDEKAAEGGVRQQQEGDDARVACDDKDVPRIV